MKVINWISVKDETIPLEDVTLLVYLSERSSGSRVHTGVYHKQGGGVIGGHFAFDRPSVTHWARIPNLPK